MPNVLKNIVKIYAYPLSTLTDIEEIYKWDTWKSIFI
jgi:hypothetical protein